MALFDWGSRGRIMADAARARSSSTSLAATVSGCRSWGFQRGRKDARAGLPRDPGSAIASSDVARDASDPTFRSDCLRAILEGYVAGYERGVTEAPSGSIFPVQQDGGGGPTPSGPSQGGQGHSPTPTPPGSGSPSIETCTKVGYAIGYDDGKTGRASDSASTLSKFPVLSDECRAALLMGYDQGYRAGAAARLVPPPVDPRFARFHSFGSGPERPRTGLVTVERPSVERRTRRADPRYTWFHPTF